MASMRLTSEMKSRRGMGSVRRAGVTAGVALVNVALIVAALAVMWGSTGVVLAQDEAKDEATPMPGGSNRFDVYPHPYSRGALAYTLGDQWDRTDLTYYFNNCPSSINCNDAVEAVVTGLDSWAQLSTLTFQEVNRSFDADIEFQWSVNAPELGSVGDVLAFATFPRDGGDVTFDDVEPWTVFDGGPFDLYLVATHELGHALGLDHSAVPNALMYPVLTPQTTGLTQDDAAAIQALYGTPDQRREPAPSNPVPGAPSDEVIEVSGYIDDSVTYEEWEFDAFAGETLTITLTATSGDLVPYLGITTFDGETVLAESGPGVGGVAQVSYTFDRDDTYVAVATREGFEEGTSQGDYVLSLTTGEAPAVPSGNVPTGDDVAVDVRSFTEMDVCEVYISPTSEDEWGENLLTNTLTNGNLRTYAIPAGTWDVLVVGCDGTEMEQYEIEIRRDLAIEIYDEGLNVFEYEA